jgi:hypothetical protein
MPAVESVEELMVRTMESEAERDLVALSYQQLLQRANQLHHALSNIQFLAALQLEHPTIGTVLLARRIHQLAEQGFADPHPPVRLPSPPEMCEAAVA